MSERMSGEGCPFLTSAAFHEENRNASPGGNQSFTAFINDVGMVRVERSNARPGTVHKARAGEVARVEGCGKTLSV